MEFSTVDDIPIMAKKLLRKGVKNVLIKGGHLDSKNAVHDYFSDGEKSFWIHSTKLDKNVRGTGCALASAIATMLHEMPMLDAIIYARAWLQTAISTSSGGIINYQNNMFEFHDFPYVTKEYVSEFPKQFQSITMNEIEFYPIVDMANKLEELFEVGVKTAQLRIKDLTGRTLEKEIKKAVKIQNKYGANLFINDYWELAIKHGAYGVHLGQEDMQTADLDSIFQANLRLGISSHSYFEAATAKGSNPSYVALGPIFHTTSKTMPFAPQTVEKIKLWKSLFPKTPICAIGGITLENIDEVLQMKPHMVSMIGDIANAKHPANRAKIWLEQLGN